MSLDRGFLLMAVTLLMPLARAGMTNVFYDVRYVYNNVGDVVAVRRYTNETSYVERTYEYDAFGRKTKETDEVGNTLHISYDAIGNIVEMRGATYPIKCAYNSRGNLVSLRTTKDGTTWHETKWTYNPPFDSPIRKEYPDG